MSKDHDDSDRNPFAQEMIAHRRQKGWTQEELAARMLVSISTVANIESCYRAPTSSQAVEADQVFETPGTFQRHERQLRGIPFSAGFRPFRPHEEQARLIRLAEHSMVPGLFQVEEYAQGILGVNPETTDDIVKEMLEARLARQEILFRRGTPPPPRVHAILDEQLLRRNVGGPAVMARQMEYLAMLARRPRVTVQVFPEEKPHTGLLGAFVIADTGQEPPVVYIDGVLDGQVIESALSAERADVVFRALQTEAFTASVSLARVEAAAQWWKDKTAS